MGSSLPHMHIHWVLIALVCGGFYLIFDALRSFALQLSPVRLRRLSSDSATATTRHTLMHFDVEDFQLVRGAFLQVALVVGSGATTMLYDELPIGSAVLTRVATWAVAVLLWKFVLALVPEDTGEMILRALIPFSR